MKPALFFDTEINKVRKGCLYAYKVETRSVQGIFAVHGL